MSAAQKVNVLAVRSAWELTEDQWEAERYRVRPCFVQSNFTKASVSQAVAAHDRLIWLLGGVRDAESAELTRAQLGELQISKERAEELLEILNTRVTYAEVVAHGAALARITGAQP